MEKSWMWWFTLIIPKRVGSINKRITFYTYLGKKQGLISKIIRSKRTRDVAQAVKSLPHKPEALHLILSIAQNIKNKKSTLAC
jgi:hypothetical protein